MANADYQRYVNETLALARSLQIKSEGANQQINLFVESLGYTLPADPREWRYYRHLAGRYHFLDRPMEIRSLDTLTAIPFTQEVLRDHPVTREFYQLGSDYYTRLVERYSDQEQLIRGILYPLDIDYVIEANDHTILDYDKSLVESNEHNLIPELQKRIDNFFTRWNVPGYHVIDELFTTSHLATLYYQLPMMLMNIRLENCHTPYVHGFHIREFLKSHGRLDRYYDFLTRKQHLFLYRNIRYIETHAGKQDTFDWIIERILTERGMGIAEYTLHHDLTQMPDNPMPEPEFLRVGLNRFHRSVRSEEHTFNDILDKEAPLTVGNPRVQEATLADDYERLIHTKRNRFPTKALESSIVDTSTGGYVTLVELLFNHWTHWSLNGQYQGTLRIRHPRSGALMDLSPKDSVYLYWYCVNKAYGHTIPLPLTIRPTLLRKDNNPTKEEMRRQVDMRLVDEEAIAWFASQPTYTSIVRLPRLLHQTGVEMLEALNSQREYFSLAEHYQERGYLEGLFWSLYETREYTIFENYESVDDWLFEKGYNLDDLTQLEYEEFATELFAEVTGLNTVVDLTMSDIQEALVTLVAQLSSYSVQFIREVNEGPIRFQDRLTIRLGDLDGEGRWMERVPVPLTGVTRATTHGTFQCELDVRKFLDTEYSVKTHHRVALDVGSAFDLQANGFEHIRLPMPPIAFSINE